MQHALIHYLFHIGKQYNINIKNATESMFKLQDKYKWNNPEIIDHIMNKDLTGMYGIKLTGGQRNSITDKDQFINRLNAL